jgi:lysozyme
MQKIIFDVSHYQSISDYNTIKEAGYVGMIHKATQGFSFVDPKYIGRKQMWKNEMGQLFGSYHFQRTGNIGNQVNFFLDTIGDYSNEILILDYEDGGQGLMSISEAAYWLKEVKERTGRPIVFYASDVITKDLNNDFILNECHIWVARYGQNPVTKNWKIWQHSESENIPGIGKCDSDMFYSDDIQDLYKFWDVKYPAEAINGHDQDSQAQPENHSNLHA